MLSRCFWCICAGDSGFYCFPNMKLIMESFSLAHRNLQMFCADFWEDPASCVVILNDIGISPGAVDMTPPAIMRWYSIIRHLMRLDDGSMSRLVVALMAQYPANDALRRVCSPWIPAQPLTTISLAAQPGTQGSPQGGPATTPAPGTPLGTPVVPVPIVLPEGTVLVKEFKADDGPPVPVVAPHDFAEEADAVVPRMETLWATVIEQDRHIRELERRWTELYEWRNSLFGGKPIV